MKQAQTGPYGIPVGILMGYQHDTTPGFKVPLQGLDVFGIHAGKDTILIESLLRIPTFTLNERSCEKILCTAVFGTVAHVL